MERVVERLEPPYEIFELADGESRTMRVETWQLGLMTIHPRYPGAPKEKTVEALRLHVPAEVKPTFPHYWDITAGRLRAQLLPILRAPGFEKLEITVTKRGVAPRAYFEVSTRLVG